MASIVGDGTALHVTFDSESHSSTHNLSWRKQGTMIAPPAKELMPLLLAPNFQPTVLAQGLHSIADTGEQSLVAAHEGQIIVICYVGLRANPC